MRMHVPGDTMVAVSALPLYYSSSLLASLTNKNLPTKQQSEANVLRKTASNAALRRAIGIIHPTTICTIRLFSVRPETAFPSLQPFHNVKCNGFLPAPWQQIGILSKTSL